MSSVFDKIKTFNHIVKRVTQESKPVVVFKDFLNNPNYRTNPPPSSKFTSGETESFITKGKDKSKVVVLDSSFNPPTLAHKSLILNSLLSLLKENRNVVLECVLLLSCNNMDKFFQSGANIEQRLALMEIMTDDLIQDLKEYLSTGSSHIKFQIGLTNCGKFVDKAKLIHESLQSQNYSGGNAPIYFVMGYDTITRFFDPKYYLSDHQQLQKIISQENPLLKELIKQLDPFFHNYNSHIIYITRGEAQPLDQQSGLTGQLLNRYKMSIQNIPLNFSIQEGLPPSHIQTISSTKARSILSKSKAHPEAELNNLLSPSIIKALQELNVY